MYFCTHRMCECVNVYDGNENKPNEAGKTDGAQRRANGLAINKYTRVKEWLVNS